MIWKTQKTSLKRLLLLCWFERILVSHSQISDFLNRNSSWAIIVYLRFKIVSWKSPSVRDSDQFILPFSEINHPENVSLVYFKTSMYKLRERDNNLNRCKATIYEPWLQTENMYVCWRNRSGRGRLTAPTFGLKARLLKYLVF